MITRMTAGAFLSCGDKVLMLKRGLHKELGAGLWAGIGGHLEMDDITNPRSLDFTATCYREVYEEIGIAKKDIHNLKLRYIAVKKDSDEIRIHHFYFGELESEVSLHECNEGELHWVSREKLLELPMTASNKEVLKHWVNALGDERVYFIAISPQGDSVVVSEI